MNDTKPLPAQDVGPGALLAEFLNTTRDGIEVKPGQKWRDRDKRMRGRVIVITRVQGGFAYFAKGYGHAEGRIGIARMHNKSTGFELVG